MKREQRVVLQRALAIVSFLVAIFGTVLWYRFRAAGEPLPAWLMAVVAYGWTFTAFLAIDRIARAQARKRRPNHFRQGPGE